MRDRLAAAPGQYNATVSAANLQKLQSGEQFTIQLKRNDRPIVEGTPYSKAAVLPDEVASKICPDVIDPTPADAFLALANRGIVSQGVKDGVTYRQWANGMAECWTKLTYIGTPDAGGHITLPFGFKKDADVRMLASFTNKATSQISVLKSYALVGDGEMASKLSFVAHVYDAGTGQSVMMPKETEMDVYIVGAWKDIVYGDSNEAVSGSRELPYDWETLSQKCKAGDFSGINVGDYKIITLTTGEEVVCEVAGIDTYYSKTKDGYPCDRHHIDFISRDCLEQKQLYNADAHNNGMANLENPFMASLLYWNLNDTGRENCVLKTLPADLRSCIIDKKAYMEDRYGGAPGLNMVNNCGLTWRECGPLWLPTEFEVWGNNAYSESGLYGNNAGCNIQYPIFKNSLQHIVKGAGDGGESCSWWLASASRYGYDSFCCVTADGAALHRTANAPAGIPLCFRIA